MKKHRDTATAILRGAAQLLGALLVGLTTGCETTTVTTAEENSAAYQNARKFLKINRTHRQHVLAEYGEPRSTEPRADGGETWCYWRTETILLNAYTGTSLGTERSIMRGGTGFQRTMTRKTRMELHFDSRGILIDYRVERLSPGQRPEGGE